MRISDWSSDVCSSDLHHPLPRRARSMSETPSPAPSARYHEGVVAHRWEADPTQLALLPEFDRMHAALCREPAEAGLFGRLKSLLGNEPPEAVPGLYLWGTVGRGKTFLMDL